MIAKEYQYWVNRLAQYDPRDNKYDDPRSAVYREMIRCNVPLEDRVAIDKAAGKLFEERKRGRQQVVQAMRDLAMYGSALIKINTEGEKPMARIDWKKPLRVYPPGERNKDQKVYTYKSGKQRVVWIDDHVYPVDDDGCATAGVWYRDTPEVVLGEQIVENVPEEKFFLGLARNKDGTYWLTDGGKPTTMQCVDIWKQVMAGDPRPHWVVDTRKPAEPPKAIEHDPKDWTVVIGWGNSTTSYGMRTEADARAVAEKHAREGGDVKVVRVRTTPSPADTARYVQLWRTNEGGPWLINKMGNGRQEFNWAETKNRETSPTRCAIKVRD